MARSQKSTLIWIIAAIVGVVVAFPLWKYVRNQVDKLKINAVEHQTQTAIEVESAQHQNPMIEQTDADKITKIKDLQAAARRIAKNLGYLHNNGFWDKWDPRTWTENDTEVADDLIYCRKYFSVLEKLYFHIYTHGRSLKTDLYKLLDNDQMKRVRKSGLKI